jgi:hypothetical protein
VLPVYQPGASVRARDHERHGLQCAAWWLDIALLGCRPCPGCNHAADRPGLGETMTRLLVGLALLALRLMGCMHQSQAMIEVMESRWSGAALNWYIYRPVRVVPVDRNR